jgi:hypothetical protein
LCKWGAFSGEGGGISKKGDPVEKFFDVVTTEFFPSALSLISYTTQCAEMIARKIKGRICPISVPGAKRLKKEKKNEKSDRLEEKTKTVQWKTKKKKTSLKKKNCRPQRAFFFSPRFFSKKYKCPSEPLRTHYYGKFHWFRGVAA